MIVAAARYSPRGERGLSPLICMANLPRPQIALDADILVIAQIEGRQALPRAAKSLPSPG